MIENDTNLTDVGQMLLERLRRAFNEYIEIPTVMSFHLKRIYATTTTIHVNNNNNNNNNKQ